MTEHDPVPTRIFQADGEPSPAAHSAAEQVTPGPQKTTDSLSRTRDAGPGVSATPAAGDLLPDRIGRFEVHGLLGRGGFAFVYRARDPALAREVALKVPQAGRIPEPFLEEARSAAQLKHANIVTIYDVGQSEDGRVFIAMELVDGPTLASAMRDQRFSPADAAHLVSEIARAVHYAHKAGFVHRDLKPGNVLIESDGTAKVADFGLAVHESRQPLADSEIAGTPAYMAPEQVRGDVSNLDGRCDIWALGVILYEMLGGRLPFRGTRDEIYEGILRRDAKPLRQIDDSIPPELEDVCRCCLAKAPGDRPSTALDVAQMLESYRNQAVSRQPSATRQGRSEDKRRLPFPGAALWLGMVVVVALALWRSGVIDLATDRSAQLPTTDIDLLSSTGPADLSRSSSIPGQGLLARKEPAIDSAAAAAHFGAAAEPEVEPILWRSRDRFDSWSVDDDSGRLSIRCFGVSLFSAGLASGETITLQTSFRVDQARGQGGLIWGVQDRVDGTRYCQFARIGRKSNELPVTMQIGELVLSHQPPFGWMVSEHRIRYRTTLEEGLDDWHLRVRLQDGGIQDVVANQQTLVSSEQLNRVKIPQVTLTDRPIGFIAEGGALLFESILIQE